VLWPDTFTNHFRPEVGRAAAAVLQKLGLRVVVPAERVCCGRPLYDFGLLDEAKQYLNRVVRVLQPFLQSGAPIIVLEPSCFAVFRDEAQNLLPDRDEVRALGRQAVLFDEFIRPHAVEGRLGSLTGRALVHGHCHQTALAGMDNTMRTLAALGADATLLDAGCCGMAGAFGFDARHYDVSMQIGERVLLPAVRRAPPESLILADGFSCSEQIRQSTGRRAHHLAELVCLAGGRGTAFAPDPGTGGRNG
jgi:Fe-S oxidoreductase